MDTEVWKSCVEGYEVSSLGRVRNVLTGRYLKPTLRYGYPSVTLVLSHKSKNFTVHSLVAMAFIGDRPDGMVINHIDGCKTNNRPENLEYITQKQNIAHSFATGLAPVGDRHWSRRKPHLRPRGEKHGRAVLTEQDVIQILSLRGHGPTKKAIGEKFGVSLHAVSDIWGGRSWTHVSRDDLKTPWCSSPASSDGERRTDGVARTKG